MENWKPVVGYEEIYEVSDLGRVRRIKPGSSTRVGRISRGSLTPDGYIRVSLSFHDSTKRTHNVARLVAIAFIPNPENKPEVNHRDGNKVNNCVDNLEWVTVLENRRHARDTGLWQSTKGSKNGSSKVNEEIVLEMRKLHKELKLSFAELGRRYGISIGAASRIIKRMAWQHV
jgi:hypothetical protein